MGKSIHLKVDFSAKGLELGKEAILETWNELKEKLRINELDSDDLTKIKESAFVGVLNKLLEYDEAKGIVTVELKQYSKTKIFLRATKINADEAVTTNRFIPRADKMKVSNRFSPKGVEWLYLGFDKFEVDARRCCLAEIREDEDKGIKFCDFKYSGDSHKVINLTVADNKSWDDISTQSGNTKEKVAISFVLEMYCKLLSESIFIPINSSNKDREYAPFHCMAQFLKSLGYDGIIYKSTVSKVGKNIVMFDKESFTPNRIF